ncbi:unnamed protein product [Rotaria magnacalcarata]|uniref:Uncharacterized protein n=1 Tax=Rotaria magnacalcarata TaxID=392030 RepID=A0A815I1M0_9BILA|nr:unnamed protein product [Rotaria magnacalcarata]CAF2108495.1 unnamed protein product [Rotaria magnacalcarata]CAF2183621.1 unnamed protein product [Rotaria magnacalcarata]CAF3865225.1 unnamed protein product [Rotaria magnacalcarata]CAF3985531.1 unnamed protein product [Rotaria magnacalcarata]
MTALRVFPFIGAFISIAAVVLAVVGVSTTYWFSSSSGVHAGLWQTCVGGICTKSNGGRPACFALTAIIAIGVAALLAIFSGLARDKSDSGNKMARLCGILSVILLFSSGILIAASLYAYISAAHATGYSFTFMAIAQFLSFFAAVLVAHWMGHSFTVASSMK